MTLGMQLSVVAAGWLTGVYAAQQWRSLPFGLEVWLGTGFGAAMLYLAWRLPVSRRAFIWPIMACLLALGWTGWLAHARLSDRLASHEDDKVTRVVVQVADLPVQGSDGVRFTGQLADPVPKGLPKRVMVFWPSACTGSCADPVEPGQRWRMALRFRQPHARLNFAGIDGERWLFAQGIRATATVRGKPTRLNDVAGWRPGIWIEQIRSLIRQRLHRLLVGAREVNVMVALAIGDQQGVSREDWEIFNLTGITHLVSISGSHVTLIAALGAAAVVAIYRRLRWRGRLLIERVPVRLVFAWSAGLVAFFYCLLAGWGCQHKGPFLCSQRVRLD